MPGVQNNSDSLDKTLRIFKKQVEKAGIIGEVKKRAEYEKPSLRLKKKSIAARKRLLKERRNMGLGS